MKGTTNSKPIASNTEKLYIHLTTDLTEHSDIIGASVTITYEDISNSYIYDGYDIGVEIPKDVEYTVTFSDVEGYETPASQTYISQELSITNIVATYAKITVKVTAIRINQTLTDPSLMITRIVDEGGVEAIRANSHRYVGSFDKDSGIMQLMQLDDSNGTKFVDDTDASTYLTGKTSVSTYALVDPRVCDVWMKLPQFYWKCTEYATDQWDFTVVYGGKPDNTYKEWDGKDLIGVYEAYGDDNDIVALHSVSGVLSRSNESQVMFKSYARQKGNGFSLVKWKHHCMMAMLFYTYYGTTNSQAVCGAGTNSSEKTTGATDSLGMTDTIAGGNGDSNSINFWGLENWWGNKYEWMDNIVVDARVWKVTEDDGTVRTAGTGGSSSSWISKLLFGENIDLIPTAASGSETTGFCDYYSQSSSTSRVVLRSYPNADSYSGVAYVEPNISSSDTHSLVGSRLAFRGDYEIVS